MRRNRVTIVQSYVPDYRVEFFDRLSRALELNNLVLKVVVPLVGGDLGRHDGAMQEFPWLDTRASTRSRRRGRFEFRKTLSRADLRQSFMVIVPLQATSIDAWFAGVWALTGRSHMLGTWGHVGAYVNRGNVLDLALERLLMHLSSSVFAYTQGGASIATSNRIDPSKVVAVMNTVDTAELTATMKSISCSDSERYMAKYGLVPKHTLAYIGGLDQSKRIDFMAEVLDWLWKRDPTIKILVGGRGPQETFLKFAVQRGQALMLGRVNSAEKAMMLSVCDALFIPGRIGLIAVEALASRRPILTTGYMYHAPEVEYLRPDKDIRRLGDDVVSVGRGIINFLACDDAEHGGSEVGVPSIEYMVSTFVESIVRLR